MQPVSISQIATLDNNGRETAQGNLGQLSNRMVSPVSTLSRSGNKSCFKAVRSTRNSQNGSLDRNQWTGSLISTQSALPNTMNLKSMINQQKKLVTPKILKHNFVTLQNGGGSLIEMGANKLLQIGSAPRQTEQADEDGNLVIEYSGGMLPPTVSQFDKENMQTNLKSSTQTNYAFKTPVDRGLKFRNFGTTLQGNTCSTLSNSNGQNTSTV